MDTIKEIKTEKKFAYDDDKISASVRVSCDEECNFEYNEVLFRNKLLKLFAKPDKPLLFIVVPTNEFKSACEISNKLTEKSVEAEISFVE